MNKGGTQSLGGVLVTMVDARHSSSIEENGVIIPLGEAAGFVIKFEDGLTLYFAGDTALFGDMRLIAELYQPDHRVRADRRPVHDGSAGRREGVRVARREAGRPDALRHVPGADRDAGHAQEAPAVGDRGSGTAARRNV